MAFLNHFDVTIVSLILLLFIASNGLLKKSTPSNSVLILMGVLCLLNLGFAMQQGSGYASACLNWLVFGIVIIKRFKTASPKV